MYENEIILVLQVDTSLIESEVGEDDRLVIDAQRKTGWWKLVSHLQVCTGYGSVVLAQDHVFDHEGGYLKQTERNLTELAKLEDGFIIWGQYIVNRMTGVGLKRKRADKKK
jgi:hypothetical protein